MPINGTRKGKVAEREVAGLVQAWWSTLEEECRFVRTPQSGGWGTPELRGEFKAAGDLMTTAERWPFTVEVKKRESWSVERFMAGKSSPVWSWWLQVQRAAREESRKPMLWFCKNRMPWLVLLPRVHYGPEQLRKRGVAVEPKRLFFVTDLLEIHYETVPVCYQAVDLLALPPGTFTDRRAR